MASGYFVAGDIRDTVETIYQGDGVGTALNAAAFAPAIGDDEKTGNTLRKLATKYPGRISEIARTLCRILPDNAPNNLISTIHESGFLGREQAIINKLRSEGKSVPEINTLVKSNLGLLEENLRKNIGEINGLAGNKNPYKRSIRKAVLGTYPESGTTYIDVCKNLKTNCFDFETNPGWTANEKYLDILIDSGDEIILSIHPNSVPTGTGLTYKKEIAFLESNGYVISQNPSPIDGYYRMIKK